ncbi:hypothetical protein Tco_0845959 [Tanacetum coccineum]
MVVDQNATNPWRTFANHQQIVLWENHRLRVPDREQRLKETKQNVYPRFIKAIIHHFISKDKSISMRNIIFMHTVRDDSILGLMRFVSKSDEYQVYGALLLEGVTNQQMQDSPAYKTYLVFATRVATPKKAKKFMKPASPSNKKALVDINETVQKDT